MNVCGTTFGFLFGRRRLGGYPKYSFFQVDWKGRVVLLHTTSVVGFLDCRYGFFFFPPFFRGGRFEGVKREEREERGEIYRLHR